MIIAAATAAGKTEAAWLPICTALLRDAERGHSRAGVKALYVAPLKALINDQHQRLGRLCSALDMPVHRWHGDVPGSRKAALMRAPDGLLLITPESLEAMFVNAGTKIGTVLGGLRYVVVDEFHVADLCVFAARRSHPRARPAPATRSGPTRGGMPAAGDTVRGGA